MTYKRWRFFEVFVLTLITCTVPTTVRAQREVICGTDVIVQAGDTLATLANQHFGDTAAYAEIVEATNAKAAVDRSYASIDNPDLIRQGWKLCIPGPLRSQTRATATPTLSPSSLAALPVAQPTIEEILQLVRQFTLLSVDNLRQKAYPGSSITIEQTLAPGENYNRYLASYRSEGLKIYALFTVPATAKPPGGWPVIIFNHGYGSPGLYRTTEGYEAHVDTFARNGYIVFRPDYRGYGNSEGEGRGGYDAPHYTIDVLNALASIQQYPDAAPDRVGMWGHSLGGYITLFTMVINGNIKAGVIWAGVVGSPAEILALWDKQSKLLPSQATQWRDALLAVLGTPAQNPSFWNAFSANNYLADLSGPLQLHHSNTDENVPIEFSGLLTEQLQAVGKTVEYYVYEGDDHNLTINSRLALERSLAFFDFYLKPKG
jgi:dienelactone hydrolase